MNSLKISARRAGSVFAAAALVLATALPGLASAATVTERSIELSSSTKSATGTVYNVKFKSQTASTDAFIVNFCTTAAIGTACTAPTGMAIPSIGTTSAHTVTKVDDNTVKVVLNASAGVGTDVEADITGVTNPSTVGVMYARIVTYDTSAAADSYTDTAPGTHFDDGSVALSITDGFGVNGAVLETMTFCASNAAIVQADCTGTTPPNVVLGAGGVLTTDLSTGTVYTQISTNAVGGAVVNLKSNTVGCGGLARAGAATFAAGCGITPAKGVGDTAIPIAASDAKFGMLLSNLTATTGSIVGTSPYEDTNYYMNYVSGDATGVTSPYGDPIYSTTGPVNAGKADLTFGANISNVTPAGNYSANFSLIATGKF